MMNYGKKSVGYYTNWSIYARAFSPSSIPTTHLTHLLYSFANIQEDGTIVLTDKWADEQIGQDWQDSQTNEKLWGNLGQIWELKKNNRGMRVLLSIGGWTYSKNFILPCSTAVGRNKFVTSSIELLENFGLDGIDLDWEFPNNYSEATNYLELVKELRFALDSHFTKKNIQGSGFELTIAAPCGPENYGKLLIREMDPYISAWHLMSYDYSGSWSNTVDHQSALFSNTAPATDIAVNYFTSQGIHPSKLIMGIPLYGRVFCNTQGLGTPFSSVGEKGSHEPGVHDYKDLPRPGSMIGFDQRAVASYCQNLNIGEFISYDTIQVVHAKLDYIEGRGLGGTMFWELSGDKLDSSGEAIVPTVAKRLGLAQNLNNLDYKGSKFLNVRNG